MHKNTTLCHATNIHVYIVISEKELDKSWIHLDYIQCIIFTKLMDFFGNNVFMEQSQSYTIIICCLALTYNRLIVCFIQKWRADIESNNVLNNLVYINILKQHL